MTVRESYKRDLDSDLIRAIGPEVTRLRTVRHLDSCELAAAMGISASALSRLERGFATWSLAHIERAAAAFGMSASALVAFAEQRAERTGQK